MNKAASVSSWKNSAAIGVVASPPDGEASAAAKAAFAAAAGDDDDGATTANNTSAAAPSLNATATAIPPPLAAAAATTTTTTTKPRRKKNHQSNTPLFAFHDSTLDQTLSTALSGGRPKRKLKAITRFDPYSKSSAMSAKIGEGFPCPRCTFVCSYDSRQCEECALECYYEAGVGVVTLKERRVSMEPLRPRAKKAGPARQKGGGGGVAKRKPRKSKGGVRRGRQVKAGAVASKNQEGAVAPWPTVEQVAMATPRTEDVGASIASSEEPSIQHQKDEGMGEGPQMEGNALNAVAVSAPFKAATAASNEGSLDQEQDNNNDILSAGTNPQGMGEEPQGDNDLKPVSVGAPVKAAPAASKEGGVDPEMENNNDISTGTNPQSAPKETITLQLIGGETLNKKRPPNLSSNNLPGPSNRKPDMHRLVSESPKNMDMGEKESGIEQATVEALKELHVTTPPTLANPQPEETETLKDVETANSQSKKLPKTLKDVEMANSQSTPGEDENMTNEQAGVEPPKEKITSQSQSVESKESMEKCNPPSKTVDGMMAIESPQELASQSTLAEMTSRSESDKRVETQIEVASQLINDTISQPAPKETDAHSTPKEGKALQSVEGSIVAGRESLDENMTPQTQSQAKEITNSQQPKTVAPQPVVDVPSPTDTQSEVDMALVSNSQQGEKETMQNTGEAFEKEDEATLATQESEDTCETGEELEETNATEDEDDRMVSLNTMDTVNEALDAMLNAEAGASAASTMQSEATVKAPESSRAAVKAAARSAGARLGSFWKKPNRLSGSKLSTSCPGETAKKTVGERPSRPSKLSQQKGESGNRVHERRSPFLAKQLYELQAKYDALLSAEKENAVRMSKLESALQTKDQETTCATATISSLKGRISTLEEEVSSLQENLKHMTAARDDLAKKIAAQNPQCNNTDPLKSNPSLPEHLSPSNMPPEDVSNCSCSENNAEELQTKLDEISLERDSAEEQVKELLGVQLQKDELLLQLQEVSNKLQESESRRERERMDAEIKERMAMDEATRKRRKILKLESLMKVVVSQRDRASSRVREMLLNGEAINAPMTAKAISRMEYAPNNSSDDDSSINDRCSEFSPHYRVQRVLTSFKSENESLVARLEESQEQVATLRTHTEDAAKHSSRLGRTISELHDEIDLLKAQYNKLQESRCGNDAFRSTASSPSTFQSAADEQDIITNNLERSLARSLSLHDDLNESFSSEEGTDILAPPPPLATAALVGAGTATSTSAALSKDSAAMLNVPSLADAQAEEEEEHKVEELTNALDSLNEFENFLLDLGLEDEHQS